MTEPRFDPLALPLYGSRLIEASAGTGKTYTLAALFVRAMLGHGLERPLLPGEVLVMTFTKAATRELALRIRKRLVEAAACLRGLPLEPPADAFLQGLLHAYPEGTPRERAAHRLALAAEGMDDAAVFTIDAWCQRMLREHAFDSGSLFDEELQADLGALRRQAAQDYWRQQVAPLQGEVLAAVLALWPTPKKLAEHARQLQNEPLPRPTETLAECAGREVPRHRQALAALKAGWVEKAQAMLAWLEPLWALKDDKPLNGNKLGSSRGREWLGKLAAWAADPQAVKHGLSDAAKFRLSPAGVRDAFNAGKAREFPTFFAEFETLMQALAALPPPEPALRLHGAASVLQRMQQLKAQAGTYGFADMLQRLDDALDEATQGERARRLRQRIVAQYPLAMVDEFQDTSPRQLSIFNRLYRIANAGPGPVLLLIGDPKQSIYAFRGADIASYLQAREATAGRWHALGVNHRSSEAMVAAVNACFQGAEQRPGAGAFRLRRTDGCNGLPFLPVAAAGRAERFVTAQGAPPALHWCHGPALRSPTGNLPLFAALCAEAVVSALNDAQCGFEEEGKPFERLQPRDVAVLVRNGREAEAVQRALRRRGVASVYLSDKESVFASAQAADLLRLLQAVAAPRSLRHVRAALATGLMALPLAELLRLAQDDEHLDAQCDRFAQLQPVWRSQGVLAMLRRALHLFELPARWLQPGAQAQGERRLTNLLHLAELLQARSEQVEGEHALLRWLAQQVEEASQPDRSDQAPEEAVMRLESDADRVQVVTFHKSKGLEYPLVFLPFAAHFTPRGKKNTPFVRGAPGPGGPIELNFQPDAEALAIEDETRLQEDLRLLYVAFTRARHRLWVGTAALTHGQGKACTWHRSALGWLLSGAEPREPEGVLADLQAITANCSGHFLELAPQEAVAEVPVTPLHRPQEAPALRPARDYTATFDRLWAIGSYSALVRGAGGQAEPSVPTVAATLPEEAAPRLWRDDEPAEAPPDAAPAPAALPAAPWHRFPRGALAGNFLHAQLEWLAGEGFALNEQPGLAQALVKRCERQGWGHRSEDVLAWMRALCARPLPALEPDPGPGPGVPLSGLQRTLPEMEFWFPSTGLSARRIDALCRQHILPGRPRPELPERALHGLLMGFADLVFEHEGRYGVLDHKSNALGPGDASYTEEAMAQAMLQHRYDVQAALYLLALHRLLKARLGAAYAPQHQLHGAVYWFLRGVASPSGGAFLVPPPLALIEALDALLPKPGASA